VVAVGETAGGSEVAIGAGVRGAQAEITKSNRMQVNLEKRMWFISISFAC
jgi:hypothetical protein